MADPATGAGLRLRVGAVEWREVDGEVVALDLTSSSYLAVNPSGAVLWPALDAGTTREMLVSRLVEAFEIPQGQASRDVDAFLSELRRLGLLEN